MIVAEEQDRSRCSRGHLLQISDGEGDATAGVHIQAHAGQALTALCIHLQLWPVCQNDDWPAWHDTVTDTG